MEADLGRNPSYLWRGIWKSRDLLKMGCRWRIGNGKSVNIIGEPWLRNKQGFLIDHNSTGVSENTKVSELIQEDGRGWKLDLISESFTPDDASFIKNIPICSRGEDELIWNYTPNGEYSSKSGYKIWKDRDQPLHIGEDTKGWGKIWQLKVPPKIRLFMWRFCSGCLPLRTRLRTKGIELPTDCALCEGYPENDFHLFFSCTYASRCWELEGFSFLFEDHGCCQSWFLQLLKQMPLDDFQKIWNCKHQSPTYMVEGAFKYLKEWQVAQEARRLKQQNHNNCTRVVPTRWTKPPPFSIKCNIDAAVPHLSESCSIGIVVRDETGSFLQAKTICLSGCYEVHEAEAIGLREALSWIISMFNCEILFEVDAKRVTDALTSLQTDRTEFGCIIEKCRAYKRLKDNISVSHISRLANKVAHTLAKVPCSINYVVIFSDPSSIIEESLLFDSVES